MKKAYCLLFIIALSLFSVVGCNSIANISSSVPEGYSPAKITEMYVKTQMIGGTNLSITITPPKYVEAGRTYPISLYEKGKERARTKIVWSQPDLNVNNEKELLFPLSAEEISAYKGKDLSGIFTVGVGKLPLD